MNKVSLGWAGP